MNELAGGLLGLLGAIGVVMLLLWLVFRGLQEGEQKWIDEPTDRKARAEARRIYCTNTEYYRKQQSITVHVNNQDWIVQVEDII